MVAAVVAGSHLAQAAGQQRATVAPAVVVRAAPSPMRRQVVRRSVPLARVIPAEPDRLAAAEHVSLVAVVGPAVPAVRAMARLNQVGPAVQAQ